MNTQPPAAHDEILETMEFAHGIDIDLGEAYRKIVGHQWVGAPGRAGAELVQNFLDAYPVEVPWEDRLARIESEPGYFCITDFGEGLAGRDGLRALVSLGGTTKTESHIGRWGLGVWSVFHPRLETQSLHVTSKCEGAGVEVAFFLDSPDRPPRIEARLLDQVPAFGTRVEVRFHRARSAEECLASALEALRWYPCRVTVNGRLAQSVWCEPSPSTLRFAEGGCDGIISEANTPTVVVLRRYDKLVSTSLARLVSVNHPAPVSVLQAFKYRGVPYVPAAVVINKSTLNTTVSRDCVVVDGAFEQMVETLRSVLKKFLLRVLSRMEEGSPRWASLVLANQYVLAEDVGRFLRAGDGTPTAPETAEEQSLMELLAEAKLHRIADRKGRFSLRDLHAMWRKEGPLFFSPGQLNVRWLGGRFRHAFVAVPASSPRIGGGAPDFAETVFRGAFGDVIDLDKIERSPGLVGMLIRRGVVSADDLRPATTRNLPPELSNDEREFLAEVNALLRVPEVLAAVHRNLYLPARSIRAAYFTVLSRGEGISTGLFTARGEALAASDISHARTRPKLMLGLARQDPGLARIRNAKNPLRAYFATSYLCNALARSQSLLVPFSPHDRFVRASLSCDVRRALLKALLGGAEDRNRTGAEEPR